MGASYRKRIRLADGTWQNITVSSKGIKTSTSIKKNDVTMNISDRGIRGTFNLSSILPGARYTTKQESWSEVFGLDKKPSKKKPEIDTIQKEEPSQQPPVTKTEQAMPPPPKENPDPIIVTVDTSEQQKKLEQLKSALNLVTQEKKK